MSRQKIVLFLAGAGAIALMAFALRYLALDRSLPEAGESVVVGTEGSAQEKESDALPVASTVAYRVESVATGLAIPWSVVFTSPERILVTERTGAVRVIEKGKLQEKPLHTFSVHTGGEEGLMGMTLDPDYPQNSFIYFSYAYENSGTMQVRVVRLKDEGERLTEETILLDRIPAAKYHAGSRLAFGPDGKLYISTGDATEKNFAQDKQSLAGKILRINKDGSLPSDNPFGNSPVWSLGHRNPQGLAWNKQTGALLATEHGPSVFDGPAGGDEINQIEKGKNYGWPIVSHERKAAGLSDPLLVFTPAVAPAAALSYSGRVFPQFEDVLLFGALKGEGIYAVRLTSKSPHQVVSYEKLADIAVGRVREVMEGPDGFIYFTTSNTDGRGKAQAGDDHLYRLVPK